MTRHRRAMRAATVGAIALFGAACSVQADDSARVIPEEEREEFVTLDQGDPATGSRLVYLLAPADQGAPQQLRAVQRNVAGTPTDVLTSLFAGPNNEEQAEGLTTAVPADLQLRTVRNVGRVLTVDITTELNELTAGAVGLAVAQIVTTASELDSVDALRLVVEGQEQVWPVGNGNLSPGPLTTFDYPGLVESSQPDYPPLPADA